MTQHNHGRVVDDTSKAKYKVVGNKLEINGPIVKVTVKSGNVDEGFYLSTDQATAKSIDAFT